MKYPVSPFPTMPIFDLSVQYLMAVKGEALEFVQIGANDGVYGDPLHEYVVKFPWRGILVEPQPDIFERLRANYDDQKERLIFENLAISDHSGQITMYRPKRSHEDRTTFETSVSSVNPEVTGKQLRKSKNELEAFSVPCDTLNGLLEKHRFDSVDVLQIDAEGHELRILNTLDLSRFTPLLVQFECGHLSPAEIDQTMQYLAKNNYRMMYGGIQLDSLAFHETFPLSGIAS